MGAGSGGDRGVIAFVTNGSFIDSNVGVGVRRCLIDECRAIYALNLRGNQRTSGEESRREGGKIFGEGSRVPVAILVLVKDRRHRGPAELFYHDIGDYLSREEKLARVAAFGSIDGVPWQRLTPDAHGDWITRRDPEFATFVPLARDADHGRDHAVFQTYSLGLKTNRDAWVYNGSRSALERNARRMIAAYTANLQRYADACARAPSAPPPVEAVVDRDPAQISWSRSLLNDLRRGRAAVFRPDTVTLAMYRPFTRRWLYFDRRFIEMVYRQPSLFPTPRHPNTVIAVTGVGATVPFSALAVDCVPDLGIVATTQCFPRYRYEPVTDQAMPGDAEIIDGYARRDTIADWALRVFQMRYGDPTITKDGLFWHVYGVLHAPDYRARFADTLRRVLPRIPLVADREAFRAFSAIGRQLGELHLGYERVAPYPLIERWADGSESLPEEKRYRVTTMRFAGRGRDRDRTALIYNPSLTLSGIPDAAYAYQVNGKSPLEWIVERYQVRVDRDSDIVDDPNEWMRESGDWRALITLIGRVVRVSVDTARLVSSLPPLRWEETEDDIAGA